MRKGGEGRKNRTVWARGELVATVIKAVKAGERPTDVTAWSPFTGTCVRKLARANGVEAAARAKDA